MTSASEWFELGAQLDRYGRIPKQITRDDAVALAVEQRERVRHVWNLVRDVARKQGDATVADLLAIWHDKALRLQAEVDDLKAQLAKNKLKEAS